jgi:hypothetical protein
MVLKRRSRWLCCVRRRSAAARLSGSLVRIPLRTWMSVFCELCVLCRKRRLWPADHSFRGVLLGVCPVVCDLEILKNGSAWVLCGLLRHKTKTVLRLVKNSLRFMEPEVSLPRWKQSTASPYPEIIKADPRPYVFPLNISIQNMLIKS